MRLQKNTTSEIVDVWFDFAGIAYKMQDVANGTFTYFTSTYALNTWKGTSTLYAIIIYNQSSINPTNNAIAIVTGSGVLPELVTTSVPIYIQLNAGTSDAINGAYYNIGSNITWEIGSFGFSSLVHVNLQTPQQHERIYSFANIGGNQAIFLSRQDVNNALNIQVREDTTVRVLNHTSDITTAVNTWMIAGNNVTKIGVNNYSSVIRLNKTVSTGTGVSTITSNITDRTPVNNWIGKSHAAIDVYAKMQIRELLFFSRRATDATITGWENTITL